MKCRIPSKNNSESYSEKNFICVHLQSIFTTFYSPFATQDNCFVFNVIQHMSSSKKENNKINRITDHIERNATAENHTIKFQLTENNHSENDSKFNIYKSLIDNSPSAFFLTDSTGKIIEVNNSAEQLFGFTKSKFLEININEIIDHADENLHKLFTSKEGAVKPKGELCGIKNNRERFYVEATSTFFTDDLGNEFTCTMMQDITIRKKAEQELRLMLKNTEEGFILLNSELIILNFNTQFKELYKKYFKLPVQKGLSILNFVKPERIKIATQIYSRVLKGEVVYKDLDAKDEKGIKHYFKIKYAPSKNKSDKIIGVFVTIRDISDEIKYSDEVEKKQILLDQAKINYREIFDKANDAILIHEIETGRLIDINSKGCELFGESKEEIIEKNPAIYAINSTGFAYDVAVAKLKQAAMGETQIYEWICRHSSGTLNWVEVRLQKATIAGSERILAYYRFINDRKDAEAQAELERRNKEALINTTDDLIWSIDRNLKLIAANEGFLNMLEKITGKQKLINHSVLPPEFGEEINKKWETYYQRALAGEKYSVEDEYIDPATNLSAYELVSFNPIYNEGVVTGVACYSKNITELTINQMAVKAANAELDNIMANSLDMICTISENNLIKRISAASEIVLGYKPEELIGKNMFDFIYHEDAATTLKTVEEVMAGKKNANFYNRYVRKDGSLVYLEWTSRWNEQANMRYGIGRDVTAKVEAENTLKLSEKRFKSLVQDGADMIGIIDEIGNYTYVSPTSFAILGYKPEEFINKNAFDYIHPDDVEMMYHQFSLLEHNKKLVLPAFRFKNKNNEWRWIETSLINLLDEPSIQGIVANSRDITERKNIEEALLVTKENYKILFENSPAPMFIFDFETLQIIDCNQQTLLKYGYTKEEFLQLSIKDLRPKEDISKLDDFVHNEESYADVFKYIWRHKKKNGEIMYMDISDHKIDFNGKKVSVVMLIDITEKLKIEQQNEFEKRDKEVLINNTVDLIWSVSKDYKLIVANTSFTKSLEAYTNKIIKPGDVILLDEIYTNETLTFWKKAYKLAFSGKVLNKVFYSAANEHLPEFWMDVKFNPFYKDGKVEGVACYARNITESKKAAEELRLSEEKYRFLFYKSPMPKLIYDIETLDIVEVNENAISHYGYTREEFLKKNIVDLRLSKDSKTFDSNGDDVLESHNSFNDFSTHVKKNGELIQVEISGHKIIYENKKCRILVVHDVTERETALQILKDKDAKLEYAQQIAKLGYWQLDVNSKSLYGSKQLYDIWELSEDCIIDYDFFFSTVHPDDKLQILEIEKNVFVHQKNFEIEHRIIMPDGNIKWIHEKARLEKNEEGRVIYITGTAQDITERKKIEEIINQSNQRYEHVIKATYDAIWEWDLQKNTSYRGEGFERTFGFDLKKLNSKEVDWNNYIHIDDRDTASKSINDAITSTNDYWSHEYRIIKPNGEQAYVEDRAYILRNDSGKVEKVIGALRDITERKYYHDLEMLEREILEMNAKGEFSIEEISEKYIIGIQKLHPGMIGSMHTVKNNHLYNLSSPDIHKEFLEKIEGLEIGNNVGSCGTAAFLKKIIIVADIAKDVKWADGKKIALKQGFKACWSHPIFDSKNNVVATFAIYYKMVKKPTLLEENTIKRGVNILQAVLESYQKEADLQESNQRYSNVTKATFDAIWDWDITTGNIFWGESYWLLFGKSNDNNVSDMEQVLTRLHPDEKMLVVESASSSLKGLSLNWSMEHRYLKSDNTYAYVYNKALIVRDDEGRAIRVYGAMQDVTRQKQEEQRLKLMSSVVTNTNDAVLITEAEPYDEPGHRIVFVNEAFTKMTGYTEAELVGISPRILQGPKTDKSELKRLKNSIKKWESCDITVINYKKNGEEFWNNFTLSPVADEKGNYTHWIGVERDVTERKKDELQKELLRKIRIIFNEPIGIRVTLYKVLKEVTLFGGFCFAESWLLSADKKEIKRATYYVSDPSLRHTLNETSKINIQKKGEGLVGSAWEKLELQIWDANIESKNILDKNVLTNAGVKKLYALPFLNNAEIIGVLVFALDTPVKDIYTFDNLFNSLKIYLGAEIKRKQLEQELNQIFTFAPDIIAIVGKDGYFKKINPAASDLLEYSLQELKAVPFSDFVHEDDKEKTSDQMVDLNDGKSIYYFENRYITKSGKIKWLAWTCTPSLEEDVIFAVAKNITEKQDLQVVLDKANQLARIGSWEIDLKKNTVFWSDITKEIHQVSNEFEITLPMSLQFFKKGISRDTMSINIENAMKQGISWDVEVEVITQHGKAIWVRSIGEPEFNFGKCIKIYGSVQDIDARKRADENIRSSEQRRELIMKAALDAIICIDKNNCITFWNPQAEIIFGWKENEIMGKNLTELIIPDQYKERHENGMKNYFKSGTGQALNVLVQFSAIRKNGEEFPIELTVLPIEQNDEEYFCAFVRDITERKSNETRLIDLNHSLQQKALELVGINKDLEQFAYVASHDLQEPLRMITSFIAQLEKRYGHLLDEKGKKYIHFVVDGAQRMRHIILDLLEYSKIGRIEEMKEIINLNDIVDEIKILYARKIEEQQAIIHTDNLPVLQSYKSPLRQVFQNIISNSLKYCKSEKPCIIEILAKNQNTHWEFSFKDNGIGISEEYYEKIFIIFQRLHTKDIYSGTGMGLAVTKKIIENLNGKIWVESVEGEGSVFHFTLPKF